MRFLGRALGLSAPTVRCFFCRAMPVSHPMDCCRSCGRRAGGRADEGFTTSALSTAELEPGFFLLAGVDQEAVLLHERNQAIAKETGWADASTGLLRAIGERLRTAP